MSAISVDVAGSPEGDPEPLKYKCPIEDDYIFELSHFGFVYKIDYEYDDFTKTDLRCEVINEKFSVNLELE